MSRRRSRVRAPSLAPPFFIIAEDHGGATGNEVYSFSEQIINAVNAKFGVILEREVNIL
ncbi:MAG: hypothetical protein EOO92_07550 [Pedobacter sp.]|nr:MAG: hypothetical protein EOO92_07550 [Pedobacter sp.]